jgi:hypothetical protein
MICRARRADSLDTKEVSKGPVAPGSRQRFASRDIGGLPTVILRATIGESLIQWDGNVHDNFLEGAEPGRLPSEHTDPEERGLSADRQ